MCEYITTYYEMWRKGDFFKSGFNHNRERMKEIEVYSMWDKKCSMHVEWNVCNYIICWDTVL